MPTIALCSEVCDPSYVISAHINRPILIVSGSFKAPHPGTLQSQRPDDPEMKLGQKIKDLHDPLARKNFRVVVIRVEEVDRLDLNDPAKPMRWRTRLDHKGHGHWEEVELWP